ncbi:hypothetical protein VKT23_006422 [Stygiomarasmius scandens]|uniref:Uncharacterized protein n=1 Tax=Marasmiellus scandens TaxID=2682957 RepID=A0ABR1JP39_9AGAR
MTSKSKSSKKSDIVGSHHSLSPSSSYVASPNPGRNHMQLSSTSRQLPVDDSQSETLTLVDSRDDRSNTPSKQSPSKRSLSAVSLHVLIVLIHRRDPGRALNISIGYPLLQRC